MSLAKSVRGPVSKVISKFGGDVTISYMASGTYDPTSGNIKSTQTDVDVKGVLSGVSLREAGGLIQAGDKLLKVAAADLATAPGTSDRVVIGGVTHQIIQVDTLEQANEPIVYDLVLRA